MVLDNSLLLTPWFIFLVAIFIVGIAIIILNVIEKRLNKKLSLKVEKEKKSYFYKNIGKIGEIKDSRKFLNTLDRIAREFFNEKLKMNHKLICINAISHIFYAVGVSIQTRKRRAENRVINAIVCNIFHFFDTIA